MKIDILPNMFMKDGKFDLNEALILSGKIAGVCYDKEGFNHITLEDESKTWNRINTTLKSGHHSVYDHVNISFNIHGIPKILAMVINNEHEYTTSEKSARYTKVRKTENSAITDREADLYNKWLDILKPIIKEKYGYIYDNTKIRKLAQENARYMVTVFMPTEIVYTTTLRQINYIASWMIEYINNAKSDFEIKLSRYMKEFIDELKRNNVLVEELMSNNKHRSLSLFGDNLASIKDHFDYTYVTTYDASLACVAQAQRHRTLDYKIELMDDCKFYVPPILEDDPVLESEWIKDIESVKDVYPQGQLVKVLESGKLDDFLLKCKERLCSDAQLEIMDNTKETLYKYKNELENLNSPLKMQVDNYTSGARCTFKDFECSNPCMFKEGINLTRKI